MTCVESASEKSDRVKSAAGFKYSMCKACTKSMNAGGDGAGEELLEICLKTVIRHHNAMFGDAPATLQKQFILAKSCKAIDRGVKTVMQTVGGPMTVYDCIELNTLGDPNHSAVKDIDKMILSCSNCGHGTYLRWWIVPWEKEPVDMEILKCHLLRQLRLTVGVNRLLMPRLQVFLIACSEGTVKEFQRELKARVRHPETFVTTNVHVYNGCPAPHVPPENMCLVRNRDVKGLCYTMVSMLDRVDPWIMHAGLAKSNQGRMSRKVRKGGTKETVSKNGRKHVCHTGGEFVTVYPKDSQPKCTPPSLRRNEVTVPKTIDFASMSATVMFR